MKPFQLVGAPRIAAALILYYPDDSLLENIATYSKDVDTVFVFDNTESGTALKKDLMQWPTVVYHHEGTNEGIARRLNQACRQAIAEGFDWLLTMDQDTRFGEGQFTAYLTCFHQYENKQGVAFFCTAYNTTALPAGNCKPIHADNAITSGTLLNLSLFKIIGGFDENLFIDSVDHDYLIRSRLASYSVIQFSNIVIRHRLGQEVCRASVKTLYTVKKKKIVHAPLRCYYMYRNLLYLKKKFGSANDPLVKKLRKIVTGNLKNNLLYGRQFWQVSLQLLAAYRDFKKGAMGKKAGH